MYSILTLEENREERKKWLESERAWDLRLMGDGIATKTSLTAPVICIVIIYARSRAFSFTTNSLRQTLFSDTLFSLCFFFLVYFIFINTFWWLIKENKFNRSWRKRNLLRQSILAYWYVTIMRQKGFVAWKRFCCVLVCDNNESWTLGHISLIRAHTHAHTLFFLFETVNNLCLL